ncbi:MAG: hypothetical protein ABI175_17170 [Polyangiales bacterium]
MSFAVMNTDVRELAGRAWRLLVATVVGTMGAITIAFALPIRNHFPAFWTTCVSSGDDTVHPALVIAGAVGLTLGAYAVLGALAHRWAHERVARAYLVRR